MKEALSMISGALVAVAAIPYLVAIWRDRHSADGAKPVRATWLVWFALDGTTFKAMAMEHTLNWQIATSVAVALTIFILSIPYGKKGWTMVEKICLGGAAVGIVLLSVDPRLALGASLSSLFLGAIPTFRTTWLDPSSENRFAWGLWWVSCLAALGAVPAWTVEAAAQPIMFAIIESMMVALLFVRPLFHPKAA
ncbi:MAG: Uncharacterized protein LiPW15_779 [Parcubacteria group bacterium LiPW_15]|nr:MAG: Uncharacterized protein LiPW15_779 [Parcubacteria group bacterium LiPW_15]